MAYWTTNTDIFIFAHPSSPGKGSGLWPRGLAQSHSVVALLLGIAPVSKDELPRERRDHNFLAQRSHKQKTNLHLHSKKAEQRLLDLLESTQTPFLQAVANQLTALSISILPFLLFK